MITSSWFNQSQPTSSHGKHRPPTTTWKVSTASAMLCGSILLSAFPTTVTMGCMVGWAFIYIYTQLNKATCNCTDLLLWVCVRIGHGMPLHPIDCHDVPHETEISEEYWRIPNRPTSLKHKISSWLVTSHCAQILNQFTLHNSLPLKNISNFISN